MNTNCKLDTNSRRKLTSSRFAASVGISALIGLSTILFPTTGNAQAGCTRAALNGSCVVKNVVTGGGTARIGDQITVDVVAAGTSAGVCNMSNVIMFITKPNLNLQLVLTNGLVPGGGACVASPLGADPACIGAGTQVAFDRFYTVAAADIGKPISATFQFPAGATRSVNNPAVPYNVQFLPPSAGLAASLPAGNQIGIGQGQCAILIITPCISITKECVNQCTRIGQPIQFRGQVCNTATAIPGFPDANDLVNIVVTDNPATAITFAATTSLGNPFDTGANNRLRPGECVAYSGSYQPIGNPCGPFTDTISATALDSTGRSVSNTDPCCTTPDGINYTCSGPRPAVTATCCVSTAPAITLTKDCFKTGMPGVKNLVPGDTYVETFTVRNTGDVPVQNVVIHDTKNGVTTDYVCSAGPLAVGATCTVTTPPIPVTAAQCGPISDRATATANNTCPTPVPPCNCPNQQLVTSAPADCTVQVICAPCIRITEEVVCVKPDTLCDAFTPNPNDQTNACGMRNESGSDCSAFCFKIVIEAICIDGTPSPVPATGIHVTSKLNLSGCNFPTTLQPGAMAMCIIPAVTLCSNFTDIVSVTASNSVPDADDTDSVSVQIKPIAVHCVSLFESAIDMDELTNNCVTLPDGTVDAPVRLTTTIYNDSDVDLVVTVNNLPPLVDCGDQVTPITVSQPIPIPARGTYVITGCYLADCADVTFDITVRGTVDTNSPNADCRCFYNRNGIPISTDVNDNDHCPVCVRCMPAVTCRTTGGGNLLPGFVDQSCIPVVTVIFPSAGVDHISHGGQLGAPFSQMDCGAILGNPCIRGQWEHVRHYQGNGNPRDVVDMNFHSTTPKGVFDSLSCACLGCCDPVTGAFIPPVRGPLIHKFQVCNPDDHKICGPQPRPAPANALIFSGIGRITPTDDISGPRANRSEWVIFRIYIEDRSEPGNAHAGGAVEPADIYCFQAWKTGIKTTRKPDFTTISTAFRMALGQANCDFLRALETGALPIGTLPSPTVNGVTADIQDCGPLYNGNRQIHPATGATCE